MSAPQFLQDAAREAAERINLEAVDWGDEHTDGAINEPLVESIILAAIQRAVRETNGGLADEAQILVNIIQANTTNGVCVLHYDMTIGTRSALARVRALLGTGEGT